MADAQRTRGVRIAGIRMLCRNVVT